MFNFINKFKTTITINGKNHVVSGNHINVINGKVYVDGILVGENMYTDAVINIVINGDVKGNIDTNGDVEVKGNVGGSVNTNSAVQVESDVGGSIDTNGTVLVNGSVRGDIDTNGDVHVGRKF